PKASPAATSKSIASTARRPPKLLLRRCAWIRTAAGAAAGAGAVSAADTGPRYPSAVRGVGPERGAGADESTGGTVDRGRAARRRAPPSKEDRHGQNQLDTRSQALDTIARCR